VLENLRPGAQQVLGRAVSSLRDVVAAADRANHVEMGGWLPPENAPVCLLFTQLDILPSLTMSLTQLLRPRGFHPDSIDRLERAMAERSTGAVFRAGRWRACVDRHGVIIDEDPGAWPTYAVDPQEEAAYGLPYGCSLEQGPVAVPADLREVVLDADQLAFPLELRPWRVGDRLRPLGLGGSKLVSDVLVDAKVPQTEKEGTYVLVSGGTIVWLVGHRIAEGFQATATTQHVLRLRWMHGWIDQPPTFITSSVHPT
jgi:tRNA(Ile)-lysidine synthase